MLEQAAAVLAVHIRHMAIYNIPIISVMLMTIHGAFIVVVCLCWCPLSDALS